MVHLGVCKINDDATVAVQLWLRLQLMTVRGGYELPVHRLKLS